MKTGQDATPQLAEWQGEFGRDYTDRNSMTAEQVDELWTKKFGVSRTQLNARFLKDVPHDARVLEVGCNIANQLLLLQRAGFSSLHGIEAQDYALEVARSRTSRINLLQATAFDLPYKNGYFDLVFTSGVLIHIAPGDLPRALDEIHRCSRTYILGAEYYAPTATEVVYRDHTSLLWKTDFARAYLDRFEDLKLVAEERLPYLEDGNTDSMFLLRKTYQS